MKQKKRNLCVLHKTKFCPCKKGSCNGYAKLKEDEVTVIKFLLSGKMGFTPQSEIAEIYGVQQTTISMINVRRTWSFIK